MTAPRKTRPAPLAAHIGRRVRSAERMVYRWTHSYPPIPRAVRERLADQLLAEDPTDPTEGER